MVEREESQRKEEELSRAREEWEREKQKLYQEAHQNQLRAIARQTAIVEQKLKKEFRETLAQREIESREDLARTLRSTWEEAERSKESAMAEARHDEQHLAGEEAKRVARRVAQEKREERRQADREKARALEEHTKYMEGIHRQALAEQHEELERHYAARMKEMSDTYESRLSKVKEQLSEREGETLRLGTELQEATESRDRWELSYKNLRLEFSDFIDQFPGFSAEFILK